MKKLIEELKIWLRNRLRPQFYLVFVEEDIPDYPRDKVLYIVTENGKPWSAAMVCPCGCGSILHLNLLPDERPMWLLIQHPNTTVSLTPSVWRKIGCCSHFWFRESRIYWTSDQSNAMLRDIRLLLK